MRLRAVLFLCVFSLAAALPARADTAQAKEVARMNNCNPKKIDVYQQTLGGSGKTIYHVDCNMPKASDPDARAASALLISCDASLCELLRALPPEAAKQ